MVTPIVVFLIVNWYEHKYTRLPVLSSGDIGIPSYILQNQYGLEVTNKDFKNKILVVDFFFTHCPSVCPKMTKNLQRVQEAMENDTSVLINSFSIDPERDSVGRLREFASKFNITGEWNLLTGKKRDIYWLARNSFKVDATDGDGGPNDFIHSDKLVLIDASGRIRGYYKGTSLDEVEQLIDDIEKLKKK